MRPCAPTGEGVGGVTCGLWIPGDYDFNGQMDNIFRNDYGISRPAELE